MVFLSTVFTRLFLTPLLFVLALAVGGVFVLAGRRRAGAVVVLSTTGVLLLLSVQPVTDLLIRPLEDAYPPPSVQELSDCGAVVILGGGVRKLVPGEDGWSFPGAEPLSRLVAGFRARRTPLETVVVSGGQVWEDAEAEPEADAMKRLLVELGVPEGSVVAEGESRNTWENARNSARILAEKGVSRAVLVTSAFHMGRSMLSFRAAGVDCVPFCADYKAHRGTYRLLDFLPDFGSLEASFQALHEYVGLLSYKLRRK
jgi:uncharacterized SAM-binding protein YcdF (DUF218 family)